MVKDKVRVEVEVVVRYRRVLTVVVVSTVNELITVDVGILMDPRLSYSKHAAEKPGTTSGPNSELVLVIIL